jgi:hypothetical protein
VVDGRFERENMGEGERGFFSGDRAEVDERRRSQPINRRRASTRTHSLTHLCFSAEGQKTAVGALGRPRRERERRVSCGILMLFASFSVNFDRAMQ